MGAAVPIDARRNLNAISEALCSDLQLNTGRIVDPSSNLAGDPSNGRDDGAERNGRAPDAISRHSSTPGR